MDSRIQDAPDDIPFKRDHDSVDDFEHLCHESSPDDRAEQQHQSQPRLIDAPRVDDLLHIGDSFRASDSELLPSALIADVGDVEAKSVPATPPPSADFDKCESMAQSSDPFQRPLDPVDPKLASMAFVETERGSPAHQFHDDDDNDETLRLFQPPLLPTSIATTVKDDSDFLFSSTAKITDEENKADSKEHPIEEREDTFGLDQGKWHEAAPPNTTNIDDDFVRSIKSSVLPTAEKSPVLDFLGDDIVPPREDKTKNIMDDDSWNVVEKTDVKREQAKELEPPMKPLPPLPKEAELLESARQDKYEMSQDFLVAETVKDKPSPPQRSVDSGSVKRREVPKPKEPDYICPRPAGKKKQEIEIAPKEIFKDMGLGKCKNIYIFNLEA